MKDRISLKSHAKLNWYLRVLDAREDGYHNLETVFQEVDLADDLTFTLTHDSSECTIEGFPEDVPLANNLITKAWELLRQRCPDQVPGIYVIAEKRIPRGGGLGGGSSNAAAALIAVNELCALGISSTELEAIGCELGSDVPFFIRGGCALGLGRGEKLKPVDVPQQFHLVLVFPDRGVSTAEAYLRIDEMPDRPIDVGSINSLQQALMSGNPAELAMAIHNDFELAMRNESWFTECVAALKTAGSLRPFLCGSGSTVAGLARDNRHCVEMFEQLRYIIPYTRSCTCTLSGSRTSSPVGCRDLRRTS